MVQQTCLSGVVGGDERVILQVRNEYSTAIVREHAVERLRRLYLDLTRACADLESSTESRMTLSVADVEPVQLDEQSREQPVCRLADKPEERNGKNEEAEDLLFGPESVMQDKRSQHYVCFEDGSARGLARHADSADECHLSSMRAVTLNGTRAVCTAVLPNALEHAS